MTRPAVALAALLLAGSSCADEPRIAAPPLPRPAPPAGALDVRPGEDLQARLDALPEGGALRLLPGVHRGGIELQRRVTLWGTPDAVVRSTGTGSTIDITGAGAALLGLTVDGSGGRFDLTDAAVRVRADDVQVAGVHIHNALFGVLVEKAHRARIEHNVVHGQPDKPLGMRGDAIRLWEVRDSRVEGNHAFDSRDVVVWYSSDNRIVGNTVERSRYGTHFMYSHDNEVADNRYFRNVVGVFVMYSRGVALRRNLLALSSGAAGLGLGLKESGNIEVVENRFVRNTVAVHSDNSPLNRGDHNTFHRNLFEFGDTAVVFNGIAVRTTFRGNGFHGNMTQVRVDGGDDAAQVAWTGNDFDDYRGYDLDGDGFGDVPYELRDLSSQLTSRYPEMAFFRGSPTMDLVDIASHVLPMLRPRTILVDATPATRRLALEWYRAR